MESNSTGIVWKFKNLIFILNEVVKKTLIYGVEFNLYSVK